MDDALDDLRNLVSEGRGVPPTEHWAEASGIVMGALYEALNVLEFDGRLPCFIETLRDGRFLLAVTRRDGNRRALVVGPPTVDAPNVEVLYADIVDLPQGAHGSRIAPIETVHRWPFDAVTRNGVLAAVNRFVESQVLTA